MLDLLFLGQGKNTNMNNLSFYASFQDGHRIDFPDDVALFKAEIPALQAHSDTFVQALYAGWSEQFYSAAWLDPDKGVIAEFADWLTSDFDIAARQMRWSLR